MPCDGSPTPADLIGKLDWLIVRCDKCGRRGRYSVTRLIERYGPDAKLTDWLRRVTEDCPRRWSIDMSDQCGRHYSVLCGSRADRRRRWRNPNQAALPIHRV